MRTNISRAEALAFNGRWSDADRAVIREQVERLEGEVGPVQFTVPPSREYVRVDDAAGSAVAWLGHGSVEFPTALAPSHAVDVEWKGMAAGSLRALLLTTSNRRARDLRVVREA